MSQIISAHCYLSELKDVVEMICVFAKKIVNKKTRNLMLRDLLSKRRLTYKEVWSRQGGEKAYGIDIINTKADRWQGPLEISSATFLTNESFFYFTSDSLEATQTNVYVVALEDFGHLPYYQGAQVHVFLFEKKLIMQSKEFCGDPKTTVVERPESLDATSWLKYGFLYFCDAQNDVARIWPSGASVFFFNNALIGFKLVPPLAEEFLKDPDVLNGIRKYGYRQIADNLTASYGDYQKLPPWMMTSPYKLDGFWRYCH
jgi:hypothetical protein